MARPRRNQSKTEKQSQVYDTSFKDWISQQVQDILPLLVPGVKYERTLNVEVIRPTMRADKVFLVRYQGEEHILHIEFETGKDDDLQSRLLIYNASLYRDYHLPVFTIVIYPFKVKMAVSPLLIANSQQEFLRFHFQTLPLFTLEAASYVEQHRTCMYPLLPTMRGVNADLIVQVLNELSELYHDNEVTLAQQFVWMNLLLERTGTITKLEKSKIQERLAMFDQLWEESPTVQKMREQMQKKYYTEGEMQALQRSLVSVVQARFPDLTEFAQKQAQLLNNPGALELLFRQMLNAPDTKSAHWLLESTQGQ